MVANVRENGRKRLQMVGSGCRWSQMITTVANGRKRSQTVAIGRKWLQQSQMVENGRK